MNVSDGAVELIENQLYGLRAALASRDRRGKGFTQGCQMVGIFPFFGIFGPWWEFCWELTFLEILVGFPTFEWDFLRMIGSDDRCLMVLLVRS